MYDHVTIGTTDRDASRAFYATVLPVLGLSPRDDPRWVEWTDWSIQGASASRPVTRGLHVGFAAPDRATVDAFWQAGVDAGYTSDGEPGPRPDYLPDYYGAFLLDPDGNSVEACLHGERHDRVGAVDHLWVRVAALERSRAFYDVCASTLGWADFWERRDRCGWSAGTGHGSLSVVVDARPATTPTHVAFRAADRDEVDRWHAAMLAAGYEDNGAPGLRPEHHPGYYGAFVLDPDGHNVEAVHHTR